MLKRWISCAAVIGALISSGELVAQASTADVPSIASLRSGTAAGATQVYVDGYYAGGTPGAGTYYYLQSSNCETSVPGTLTAGSPSFVNYSGPVYVGEPVDDTNLPANTTVQSTNFTAVPSWGQVHHTGTIDHIPDVSNITVGMRISAANVPNSPSFSTVLTKTPATTTSVTGTLNNGTSVKLVGTTVNSSMIGLFIYMTGDLDSPPTTSPRSAIKAGTTVVSIDMVNNALNLSDTVSGQTGSGNAQLVLSSGGSVTVSGTVTNSSQEYMIFYGHTATLSHNAIANGTSLHLTGDDGGMHIVDAVNPGFACYARNTTSPDVMGWGAKCDDVTDDTGAIQNAEIFAELQNSTVTNNAGSAGSVRFPANNVGACMATSLQILGPVPWLGEGRQQAVIHQLSGTSPLVYVFPLYDTATTFGSYSHPEMAFEDLRLSGNGGSNVGMEVDGYIGGAAQPNGSHLYMRNLTIDQFGGHEMLVDRENQVIGRGFNVQLKGIGASTSRDCLHVDGPENVWHFYDFIQSGCNNGQYLNDTGSWGEFSSVAYDNNHAVTVTGSQFSGNAPVIFTDEEFSNNFQNGFVVDSQNARVICNLCRVVDTGTTPGVYSDIEITPNASGTGTVPPLSIIGGSFNKVATGANHLYNIVFDTGANTTVLVDGTTTTTAANNKLATNIPCTGCTSTLIGDQLTDPILPAASARLAIGSDYSSANSCIYKNGVGILDLEACDKSSYSSVDASRLTVHADVPGATTPQYVQLQAPSNGTNYSFIFPTTAGTAGTVLSSQAGTTQSWADVSRLVSSYSFHGGATITATGASANIALSVAYQLFDWERSGNTTADFYDTWDTAANLLAGYGGSGNVDVGEPLRGVICNNTPNNDTLQATGGTGVTLVGLGSSPSPLKIASGTCVHISLIFTNVTGGYETVTIRVQP